MITFYVTFLFTWILPFCIIHSFFSLFVFGGFSPSRRSMGSYAVGEIPLYFSVPMERFFDETDQENWKTQGGKGQIRKIQKSKMERMEERKRRDFDIRGVSRTHVFCIGWEHRWATALVPPSLRRTHSYGNLPYNFKLSLVFQYSLSVWHCE